jgi:hypothetical protein
MDTFAESKESDAEIRESDSGRSALITIPLML